MDQFFTLHILFKSIFYNKAEDSLVTKSFQPKPFKIQLILGPGWVRSVKTRSNV